jgi:hypothetical protein
MWIVRRRVVPLLVALCLLGGVSTAQQVAFPAVRLLVVDETKTFLSTMRVGGLVGALKGTGMFDVAVRFADVESGWSDPLAGQWPDEDLERFDLLLVIPLGIDDGSDDWTWILSDGLVSLSPPVLEGIAVVRELVSVVFEGRVSVIGVYDDLLLGLVYESYAAKGWMR